MMPHHCRQTEEIDSLHYAYKLPHSNLAPIHPHPRHNAQSLARTHPHPRHNAQSLARIHPHHINRTNL